MTTFMWVMIGVIVLIIIWIAIDMHRAQSDPEEESMSETKQEIIGNLNEYEQIEYSALLKLQD